jgi:hypothetical protein
MILVFAIMMMTAGLKGLAKALMGQPGRFMICRSLHLQYIHSNRRPG